MTAPLYAFLASSGPAGVSRLAVAAWARQHGANPHTVVQAVDRAVARGLLTARPASGVARVAVSVVYVVPQPEAPSC